MPVLCPFLSRPFYDFTIRFSTESQPLSNVQPPSEHKTEILEAFVRSAVLLLTHKSHNLYILGYAHLIPAPVTLSTSPHLALNLRADTRSKSRTDHHPGRSHVQAPDVRVSRVRRQEEPCGFVGFRQRFNIPRSNNHWGSFLKQCFVQVGADKHENPEYYNWCRRFQVLPCSEYHKTGSLCFGSRGSLRLYKRLLACGADVTRKLSLLDCRQGGSRSPRGIARTF